MVGCGKKNETSGGPGIPKPSTTTEQNNTVTSVTRPLELSKINIINAQTREINPGLSSIEGIYRGDIGSIIPCTLSNPIDLKRPLSGSLPLLSLNEVRIAGTSLSNASIQSFEIKRNNRHQAVTGIRLTDNNSGNELAAQKEHYSDIGVEGQQCTQILTETYKMQNNDGKETRRVLNIVSVYEGLSLIKTTTVLDETRIIAIQIEKKTGAEVVQYCVKEAKLAAINIANR